MKRDISEVLAIYQRSLAKFKRDMKKIGVKVEVTASLGIWTSTVKEVR